MNRWSEGKVYWGRSVPDITGLLGGATKRCYSTFHCLFKFKVVAIHKPCSLTKKNSNKSLVKACYKIFCPDLGSMV